MIRGKEKAHVGVHELFRILYDLQELFCVFAEDELLFFFCEGKPVYHGYLIGRVVPRTVAAEEDFVRSLHTDYAEELFVLDISGDNSHIEP